MRTTVILLPLVSKKLGIFIVFKIFVFFYNCDVDESAKLFKHLNSLQVCLTLSSLKAKRHDWRTKDSSMKCTVAPKQLWALEDQTSAVIHKCFCFLRISRSVHFICLKRASRVAINLYLVGINTFRPLTVSSKSFKDGS